MHSMQHLMKQAFDDQCTGANPRYPLMSELKEIYIKSYEVKKEASKEVKKPKKK